MRINLHISKEKVRKRKGQIFFFFTLYLRSEIMALFKMQEKDRSLFEWELKNSCTKLPEEEEEEEEEENELDDEKGERVRGVERERERDSKKVVCVARCALVCLLAKA